MEHEWIPRGRGEALYVRPLIFAEDAHLQVRPSMRYRLLVFTSPVTNYYNREAGAVSLKAQSRYTRAAPGGVGFAKTGGNYAAALFPATESIAEGFDQALWLDGTEHRYVEEVGQMNIFFDFEGRVATPGAPGNDPAGHHPGECPHPARRSRDRGRGAKDRDRRGHPPERGRVAARSVRSRDRGGHHPRSAASGSKGRRTRSTAAPPGRSAQSSTTRSSASSSASAKTGTGGIASSRSTPRRAQAAD